MNVSKITREQFMIDVIETCVSIGLLIKQSPNKEKLIEYQHAPVSLFPTPYPAHLYHKVYDHQDPVGCLVSNLAANPQKMESLLSGFLKYDQFLADLVEVSKSYNLYACSDDPSVKKKV